jgi:hypothetical protein
MRFWKRKKNEISGKRMLRRSFGLPYWPDDMAGWLRVPSMIVSLIGILGIAKYTWPPAAVLLGTFNLPPVEFCWLMLGAGGTVYLMSLACWLFVEDVAKTCRPHSDAASANSNQWRSM